MTRQNKIDPEIPPTKPGDWTGAAVRLPGQKTPPPGAMEFHLFQSSVDRTLFIATDGSDPNGLLPCPNGGTWLPFKKFRETGQSGIAFSEPDAKRDIAERGFHLTRAGVKVAPSQ
jgi:hypothetical protein